MKQNFRFVLQTLVSTTGGIMIYSGLRDFLPDISGLTSLIVGFAILFIAIYFGVIEK